jgi:hypothetical protein
VGPRTGLHSLENTKIFFAGGIRTSYRPARNMSRVPIELCGDIHKGYYHRRKREIVYVYVHGFRKLCTRMCTGSETMYVYVHGFREIMYVYVHGFRKLCTFMCTVFGNYVRLCSRFSEIMYVYVHGFGIYVRLCARFWKIV